MLSLVLKGLPVLSSSFSGSLESKYSANEPVLRGHLSYDKQPLFYLSLGDTLRQDRLFNPIALKTAKTLYGVHRV